jgi:hypothetical protein
MLSGQAIGAMELLNLVASISLISRHKITLEVVALDDWKESNRP